MKLLLTSSGVSNPTIESALVDLLGKPISRSRALVIPTALYPFPAGPEMAARLIRGEAASPLCELGWSSLGVLELTALPSIPEDVWVPTVTQTDALLVWGGDPVFLAHWMRHSGLAGRLSSLRDLVYVGVSAGSIAASSRFAETYSDPPATGADRLSSETVRFTGPDGPFDRTLVSAEGASLVDLTIIPHYDHADHPDASEPNAKVWAASLPSVTYAIDDQSAVRVRDDVVDVVSQGRWKRFDSRAEG